MVKIKSIFCAMALAAGIASCTCEHFDEPASSCDTSAVSFKIGHILCTDGSVMPICKFLESDKEPIGVVFYVNEDENIDGDGYAVYLFDLEQAAFSENVTDSQGTSCDVMAHDGNSNTYALFNNDDVSSPMAEEVFALWKFGQSAYIPSVAQSKLLFAAKEAINDRITMCGGDPLPDLAEECWYWTSTEVDGQSEAKAWLFSQFSGAFQETPKTQVHKIRPIITINY